MGKTLGILSIKGGVGKTTTTVALGDALSNCGKSVLLVDGNLSMPNLGSHLKIIDPDKTLHDVLNRTAHTHQAIQKVGGLDVLPASVFNTHKVNPFDLKKKISGLKGKYDFILIDSSPALNDETLAAMMASDELFIVTTPDYPTLSATLKAAKLANQRQDKINGLILNKVHGRNFELSLKDIEKTSEIPVMAVIPHDVNVLKSLSEFVPLTYHNPNSRASNEFKKLAGVLVGEKQRRSFLRNPFRKIVPKKQDINRLIFYEEYFK